MRACFQPPKVDPGLDAPARGAGAVPDPGEQIALAWARADHQKAVGPWNIFFVLASLGVNSTSAHSSSGAESAKSPSNRSGACASSTSRAWLQVEIGPHRYLTFTSPQVAS